MAGFWRQQAQRVIAQALEEGRAQGLSGPALAAHVSAAWPSCLGPRENYPYQVWCDEVARQLRGKTGPVRRRKRAAGDLDQERLFDA